MSGRRLYRGLTGLALTAMAACTDHLPTPPAFDAPSDGPRFVTTSTTKYQALKRTTVLKADVVVSGWVYPGRNNWQNFRLAASGTTVSFGPYAVDAPLYVTLVANKGKFVTYEFLPHGTIFKNNVRVTQDLKGTEGYDNASVMSSMLAGYMANGTSDLDATSGTVTFSEEFDVYYYDNTTDYKKTKPSTVRFYTRHFSGYSLASGRTATSDFVDPYQ
jgi:hypothetical protein